MFRFYHKLIFIDKKPYIMESKKVNRKSRLALLASALCCSTLPVFATSTPTTGATSMAKVVQQT